MIVSVDLDYEKIDEITLSNLKDAYYLVNQPNKIDNSDEVIPVDDELLNAIDLVISYFSSQEEYQAWVNEKINLTK